MTAQRSGVNWRICSQDTDHPPTRRSGPWQRSMQTISDVAPGASMPGEVTRDAGPGWRTDSSAPSMPPDDRRRFTVLHEATENEVREHVRVLLADDQSLFREAVFIALNSEADLEVVAEACDGLRAVAEAHRVRPDVG